VACHLHQLLWHEEGIAIINVVMVSLYPCDKWLVRCCFIALQKVRDGCRIHQAMCTQLGILVLYIEVESLNVGIKADHDCGQVFQVAKNPLAGCTCINMCARNDGLEEDRARHPPIDLVGIHKGGDEVLGLVRQQVSQADSRHDQILHGPQLCLVYHFHSGTHLFDHMTSPFGWNMLGYTIHYYG